MIPVLTPAYIINRLRLHHVHYREIEGTLWENSTISHTLAWNESYGEGGLTFGVWLDTTFMTGDELETWLGN